MHVHASSLPCSWSVEGITNLPRNCILEHIGDSIYTGGITVSDQSGDRDAVKRLKSAADLMEESVADNLRTLNAARCHPMKISKPLNHVKAKTGVSSELHDLRL